MKNRELLQRLLGPRRQRVLLALVAALVCVDALLYALLVAPTTHRIDALERQCAELTQRRTEAVLFQKRKRDLAGISEGMPAQKDMPILVKDLVQSARRLHLAVGAVQYDMPKRGGNDFSVLSFTFPAAGGYAAVKRFLYTVETADRFIAIRDVELASDKGRVSLQLKLATPVREQ